MEGELLEKIERLHTTPLGLVRIGKNLGLGETDIVAWCKDEIKKASKITRRGKNWYVDTGVAIITVNAHSFTIITAHPLKGKKGVPYGEIPKNAQ